MSHASRLVQLCLGSFVNPEDRCDVRRGLVGRLVKPKLTELPTGYQIELFEVRRLSSPETGDCVLIEVVFKVVG
jgi:hypothetical protein